MAGLVALACAFAAACLSSAKVGTMIDKIRESCRTVPRSTMNLDCFVACHRCRRLQANEIVQSGSEVSLATGNAADSISEVTIARHLQTTPHLPLTIGSPLSSTVTAGSLKNFTVDVPLPFSVLHLTLSPAYGNSNLYVSTAAAAATSNPAAPGTAQYSSATGIGADSVDIYVTDAAVVKSCLRTTRRGSVCKFVIGVSGVVDSGFVLAASVDGRVKALPAGVTLEDTAAPSSYPTYSFTSASGNATFMLTTFAGSAGIYVGCSLNGQVKPRGDVPNSYCKSESPKADGSSTAVAVGSVTVTGYDSACFCRGGTYYVSAGGDQYSSYGITAIDMDQPVIALHDGLSVRASLTSAPGISPQLAALAAAGGGTPAVTLFDFTFVPGSVAVTSSPAIASITLSQFAGSGVANGGAMVFAKFHVDGDPMPIPGPSDPYGADPYAPPNAQFASQIVAGSTTILITRSDPNLIAACNSASSPLPCKIHIAVYADFGSVFTIAARTDNGLQLIDGVPVMAEAAPGSITYFRYTHTQVLSPVVFAITPVTGPVDTFVSSSASVGTGVAVPPTPTSNTRLITASSANIQATVQTIVFNPTDADACVGPCVYYIGVSPSALSDGITSFSVLARTRDVTTVALLDGQPTTDVIASNEWNYYSTVIPPAAQSIAINIIPLQGRAQVFAAVNGSVPGESGWQYRGAQAKVAGQETSLVISRSDAWVKKACSTVIAVPSFVIANSSDPFNPFGGFTFTMINVSLPIACPINVGILSDVGGAYTVLAYSRNRLLQDGVPATITVPAMTTSYFVYEAAAGASHVKISLTKLYGTPIAYVSTTESQPGPDTSFEYQFGGLGSTTLTLDSANSACAAASRSGGARCVYYIAVTTFGSSAAQFRITGSSMKVNYISIDEPLSGHVGPSAGGLVYYTFTLPTTATAGVEVTVEPTTGGWINAAIGGEVSPSNPRAVIPPTINCTLPSISGTATPWLCPAANTVYDHASWTARGFSSRTRIAMRPTDAAYVPGATYVIGLVSSYESDFVLTVKPAGEAATLLNGVLTHDSFTAAGSAFYYKVTIPIPSASSPSVVTLQVNPTEGDVIAYLGINSDKKQPSEASNDGVAAFAESYRFTLTSAYLASKCAATVPPVGSADGTCTIYMAVVPAPVTSYPTLYSVLASLGSDSSTPLALTPGVPQLGAVAKGSYAYFYSPIAVPYGTSYYVSLVEAGAGEVDLFVNTRGNAWPSITSYQTASAGFIAPEIINISPASPNKAIAAAYVNQTMLLISVYGVLDFNEFYITVGTAGSVVELPDGAAVEGSADAGGYAYYSLSVGDKPGDINVAVTALSGSSQVYASTWYSNTDQSAAINVGFRPTRDQAGHTYSSNFEGSMLIPANDASACKGACTYIFAVYCDSTVLCQFQLSASSSAAVLTRLAESVPASGIISQGTYKYYIFDAGHGSKNISFSAQETTGQVQLFVTDKFIPGRSTSDLLPVRGNNATYKWSSAEGTPFLLVNQVDADVDPASSTSTTTTSDHLYVVAVYAVAGPATFTLVGKPTDAVQILGPGMASSGHFAGFGAVDLYAYDNYDMAHDLVVSVSLLYGDVTIGIATRGNMPVCSVTGTNGRANTTCTNIVWSTSSNNAGSAVIRVNNKLPCLTRYNVPGYPCNPDLDWVPGPIIIAVATSQISSYTITADTGASPLRLLDGMPQDFVQPIDGDTQVLLFQALPDAAASDIRLSFSISEQSAPFNYYISSCVDDLCTAVEEYPGPVAPGNGGKTSKLSGYADTGTRVEIEITKASPVFCTGNADIGDVCNYYITLYPNSTGCANQLPYAIVPCTVYTDITVISLAGSAPIVVPFNDLNARISTYAGINRPASGTVPAKSTIYDLWINEPGSPDEVTQDVVVRLDACDSLTGHPVAYMCVSAPGGLGYSRAACNNLKRPSASDFNYALSTKALGYDRSFITAEPSNEIVVSVGVQPTNVSLMATADGLKRYGPSTYELSIFDGPAVRMRLPNAAPVATLNRTSATSGIFTWPTPVVTSQNPVGSPNVTATSIKYVVYWTPGTYTDYAATLLNASAADLGIVPATPCGLERWARLTTAVASNYTPIYTQANVNTISLANLTTAKWYKINVVAVCDADCMSDNYVALGLPRPTTGSALSTQRLSYSATWFLITPDPVPDAHVLDEPVSASFYGFGLVALFAVGGTAFYMGFRKSKPAVETKSGVLGADGAAVTRKVRGPNGKAVLIKPATTAHFFSSRKLTTSAGSSEGGASMPNVAGGKAVAGSGGMKDELEELARITGRVFTSPVKPALAAAAVGGAAAAGVGAVKIEEWGASAPAPAPVQQQINPLQGLTSPPAASAPAPAPAPAVVAAPVTDVDPFAAAPAQKEDPFSLV